MYIFFVTYTIMICSEMLLHLLVYTDSKSIKKNKLNKNNNEMDAIYCTVKWKNVQGKLIDKIWGGGLFLLITNQYTIQQYTIQLLTTNLLFLECI